jgi:integrase
METSALLPGVTQVDETTYRARPYGSRGERLCRTFRTAEEANQFTLLTRGLVSLGLAAEANPVRARLDATWQEWRASRDKLNLSSARYRSYDNTYNAWIEPTFSRCRLDQIDAQMVDDWIDAMNGSHLEASSVRNNVQVFRQFLTWAVGRKKFNPAELVAIKSLELPEVIESPYIPLTVEEVEAWTAAMRPPEAIAIVLGRFTGMRPSEVRGLCVERTDFLRRQLHVHWQHDHNPTLGHHLRPVKVKTKAGTRTLPIQESLLEALSAHLSRFPGQYRKTIHVDRRDRQTAQNVRFIMGPITGSTFGFRAAAVAERIGLNALRAKRVTLHDLRHHFATEALAHHASIPEVAEALGDTIETVANTYAHAKARPGEPWQDRVAREQGEARVNHG